MKYAFSVTDPSKIKELEHEGMKIYKLLAEFANSFEDITEYQAPRGIIFHDFESATKVYSKISLPAYTSRDLIHMTPLIEVWRDIFLSTIKNRNIEEVEKYYKSIDIIDLATIAAHELTHHAEIFHDDFDDIDEESMWFEEGLCFYIPRRLMMPTNIFEEIMNIDSRLIEEYQIKYGNYLLNEFGKSTVSDEYSSIFYDYWRSIKVIRYLVEKSFNGSVRDLLNLYSSWVSNKETIPLHSYLVNKLNITSKKAKELWLL